MHKLVLIRHGESTWNLENRFTGWTDVDLTRHRHRTGQARRPPAARRRLRVRPGLHQRAQARHAHAVALLDEMDRTWLPVVHSWRLNERHYGALQGLNKADMAKQYGDAQVLVWRRSYDTPPPALEPGDPRSERGDLRYAKLAPEEIPADRMPEGHRGPRAAVLERDHGAGHQRRPPLVVAAHGNSIRALVKYLDGISDSDIVGLNIPNGIPLVYELDAELKPLRHYYLGDAEAAETAAAKVAAQGKA
ncbi:MAG: 2,3-bisphosphoglycerate-dependent phosphoglycerate mutase [Pseudorhodoferax sp.]